MYLQLKVVPDRETINICRSTSFQTPKRISEMLAVLRNTGANSSSARTLSALRSGVSERAARWRRIGPVAAIVVGTRTVGSATMKSETYGRCGRGIFYGHVSSGSNA